MSRALSLAFRASATQRVPEPVRITARPAWGLPTRRLGELFMVETWNQPPADVSYPKRRRRQASSKPTRARSR